MACYGQDRARYSFRLTLVTVNSVGRLPIQRVEASPFSVCEGRTRLLSAFTTSVDASSEPSGQYPRCHLSTNRSRSCGTAGTIGDLYSQAEYILRVSQDRSTKAR